MEILDYDNEEDRKNGVNGWLSSGDVGIIMPNGGI